MQKTLLTLTAVFFALALAGQPFQPGKTYVGSKGYVEYRAGNLPIVITAPHGGRLTPGDIPDRDCAGCSTVMDANTMELAYQIDTALRQQFGCFPHIIVNRLHRRKLDANREIAEAALGNPDAETAWYEWHRFIQTAKDSLVRQFGRGLLIDLHGHGHAIQRLELGYLLDEADYRLPDAALNALAHQSSIKHLTANNGSASNLSQLLRGDFALGTLLESGGYPAVPSRQQPIVNAGEPYFNGGYNTLRHGSRDSTAVDAIQIECNNTGVRNSYANRRRFAETLAATLQDFLSKHYFASIAFGCTTAIETLSAQTSLRVFPNPFSDKIHLENPNQTALCITLKDNMGRVLQSTAGQAPQLSWPTQHLPPGIYFLWAQEGTQNSVFKLVKF